MRMPSPDDPQAVGAARRASRERAEARSAVAREPLRPLPTPKGRLAWDKGRTRELFRRYKQQGDEAARDELIMSHLNLVRFLASKFKNRGEPLDDLVQVGTIGLIKAIDRFDPDRGLEFTTYATPTVMGEIKRHFRDKGWSVRVPRRLQELSAKVNQATDELTKQLQRSPSTEEVAKRLGVSVDEVLEAMESSGAYSSVPLEGGGSDDDDSPSVIDHYATVDQDLAASDDRMVIEDTIAGFSPREQEVIRMRFRDGLTQVEIAKRLGISQVQVSRLLRRTLKKVQVICRPTRLDDLRRELNAIGVTGMTVLEAKGCGEQKGARETYRGIPVSVEFVPKVQVDIVVSKVPVADVVSAARRALYTGHIGDGKVFVYGVAEAVKVRTGEHGYDAVQSIDVL